MATVPLGHLHVHARDSDFELMLASSIKFTASKEDEVEDLTERLTANQLSEHTFSLPYLYCADSFSFLILLQFDADLTTNEHHALVETFSTQIQTAMLWQQLHFSQPSLRTEVAADGRVRMELTLTRTEGMSKIGSRTSHKLGVDVPFYDTRPPSGVPNAALDSVLLTAVIRPRLQSTSTSRLLPNPFDEQDDHSSYYADCTKSHIDSSKAMSASSDCVNDNEIADEMLFAMEPEDEAMADLEEDMPMKPDDAKDSRVNSLLILLDVSVRRSISASSASSSHVSIETDRSFLSLSTVAPTVFRADHLPAVANRALFLHTISRSAGAVTSRRVKTQASKKCNRNGLSSVAKSPTSWDQEKSTAKECSDLIGHGQNCQVLSKLWTTLDKSLLDLKPEQRLQPLLKDNNGAHGFDAETQLSNALEEADQLFDSEADSDSDFEDIDFEERQFQEGEGEGFADESDLLHDTEISDDEQNDRSGLCYVRNNAEDIAFFIRSEPQNSVAWTKENNFGFNMEAPSDFMSEHEDMLHI